MASTESMKAAFACFDANGDGVLSRGEIRAILQRNDGMSAEDVDEVLDEFDEDGDGKLDIEEFIDFFGEMDDQQVGSTVMAYVNKPVKVANAISKREGRHVAFRTHLLVIAYDYIDSGDYTPEESSGCGPLTCTADAMRLVELARKCGCPDISLMMDKPEMEGGDGWLGWPTAERVKEMFHEIAGRCKPGDTFFFYFSGHGTQSDGRSKNEADGKNEELCLCAPDGSYDPLVDDDLAALIQLLPEGVRCLSVCDCCHSATMADLDSADFGNMRVMHLGASDDSQSAQDLGGGGALTSAILEVIGQKVAEHATPPTVVDIFNTCVTQYGERFEQEDQTLAMAKSKKCAPGHFAWPLWPGKGSDYDADTPLGDDYDDYDDDDVVDDDEEDLSESEDWSESESDGEYAWNSVVDGAWRDLTDEQRDAARVLGYNRKRWDRDAHVDADDKDWDELKPEEREAARVLGYKQASWDEW